MYMYMYIHVVVAVHSQGSMRLACTLQVFCWKQFKDKYELYAVIQNWFLALYEHSVAYELPTNTNMCM